MIDAKTIDAKTNVLSRRQVLRQVMGAGLCAPLGWALAGWPAAAQTGPAMPVLSSEDDQFLEEIERASFLFFWNKATPPRGW